MDVFSCTHPYETHTYETQSHSQEKKLHDDDEMKMKSQRDIETEAKRDEFWLRINLVFVKKASLLIRDEKNVY